MVSFNRMGLGRATMAGAPPHPTYAYTKTGLMLMERMEEYYDPADIAEYKRPSTSTSGWREADEH